MSSVVILNLIRTCHAGTGSSPAPVSIGIEGCVMDVANFWMDTGSEPGMTDSGAEVAI